MSSAGLVDELLGELFAGSKEGVEKWKLLFSK